MGDRVRLVVYGFLVWLIPFAVGFVTFPIRIEQRELFESIMAVTLAAVVTSLAFDHLRRTSGGWTAAGLTAGIVWMAIAIVIDLPLFLSPFIAMSTGEYIADIGVTYLVIPIIAAGIGAAMTRAATPAA
jgi:hypothetical protein